MSSRAEQSGAASVSQRRGSGRTKVMVPPALRHCSTLMRPMRWFSGRKPSMMLATSGSRSMPPFARFLHAQQAHYPPACSVHALKFNL